METILFVVLAVLAVNKLRRKANSKKSRKMAAASKKAPATSIKKPALKTVPKGLFDEINWSQYDQPTCLRKEVK